MDRRDITELRGIGKKTGDLFRKLGVNTVEDLLHYYPRGYDAYEQPKEIGNLVPERTGAVLVRLPKTPDVVRYGRMPVVTVTVNDERADGAKESLTLPRCSHRKGTGPWQTPWCRFIPRQRVWAIKPYSGRCRRPGTPWAHLLRSICRMRC